MRKPPSKRSKTVVVIVPGNLTESPGKFLQFSNGPIGAFGSGKAKRPELVRLILVRFAKTSWVSCCVSPGKRSAVAFEDEALKRANAGATLDASASSSPQQGLSQLSLDRCMEYSRWSGTEVGMTDEESDCSRQLSGPIPLPAVAVQGRLGRESKTP